MSYEKAKALIISVLSDAGKGVHEWVPYLESDEITTLYDCAVRIRDTKTRALQRQQNKIGG